LIANSYTPVTPAPAEQNFNTLDPGFDVAKNFVKKIKARFKDRPEIYKSFLHILRTFEIEKKSISDVHKQVFGLFGDNEDLVKEFTEFLPDNTDLNVEKKAKIGSEGTHFELEMFFRIKLHLTKEGKYREFVHLMEMVNREILTKHQFSVLSHILFINNLEYWNWLNKFLDIPLDEINMDQDLIHPDLMEVDSESYVPERKTIFASGRGDKENLILNNNLISKISIQKLIVNANQDFEDKLVKWDLQIEWNNQAITTLTDIQNRLELLTQ
jgi:histone deacetylase complex regulatory component SIN3